MLNDGEDAGEQARTIDYDAVVLDLMLPGRSGFQVLRDIRARKASLPVLILTAKDSLEERVTGLDAGADDYMTKPFALAELSARLRALLRRGSARENVLRVAELEMIRLPQVQACRHAIGPEAHGIRAPRIMMRTPSRPLTRPDHRHFWDIHFDSVSNVVEVHINSLRNKIDKGFDVRSFTRSGESATCSQTRRQYPDAAGRLANDRGDRVRPAARGSQRRVVPGPGPETRRGRTER